MLRVYYAGQNPNFVFNAPLTVDASPMPGLGVQKNIVKIGLLVNNQVAAGITGYIAQMGSQLGMHQADMTLIGNHDIAGALRCLYEGIAGRGTFSAPAGLLNTDAMTEYRTDAIDSNGAQVVQTAAVQMQCEVNATPGIVPTGIYFITMNAAGVRAYRWVLGSAGHLAPFVDNGAQIGFTGGPRPTNIFTRAITTEIDRGMQFANQVSSAAAAAGTLNNAPAAGNPAFWLRVFINGANHAIPCWLG